MRIGIFIGSFNPPTNFHLDIGHYLVKEKIIDKVIYVPISNKSNLLDKSIRLKMLDIYVQEYAYMETYDLNYHGQFNYHLLDSLYTKEKEIYMLIGADILNKIDNFTNYQEILQDFNFIVINRDNYNSKKIIKEKYPSFSQHFMVINYDDSVSSTIIRNKVKNKEDISHLTKPVIIQYIYDHHLYQ